MSRKHGHLTQVGKRQHQMIRPMTEKQLFLARKPQILREIKRQLIAEGQIMDPANRPRKYHFAWVWGDLSGVVLADDRSAARGMIKHDLGLPRNKRLPLDVDITRHLNVDYYQGLEQSHANITQTSDGQVDASPAVGNDSSGAD